MITDREIEGGEERAIRVRCLDLNGELADRVVYASTVESALMEVRSQGLFPCEPVSTSTPAITNTAAKPIRDAVLLRWLRAMKGLVGVGNLKEQLLRSSDNIGDRRLKSTIREMLALMGEGVTHLEELMSRCWRDFPAWMIGFIRLARTNARLRQGIERVTIILERNEKARRGRKLMMLQPRLLSFLLIALMIIIGAFLVPSIEHFTEKACQAPPAHVKALFALAKVPLSPIGDILIIVGILAARTAFKAVLRTDAGALMWDRFQKSLPGAGHLDRLDCESRISRGLAFLFDVGAPRSRALTMLNEAAPSPMYGVLLREIDEYYKSESLTRLLPAFERSGEFSSTFIHHLSSAESVTPSEGALLMDGCSDELDAEIETSREEATHKLSMRILYIFAGVIGAIILTVIPYSMQMLTNFANNPAACTAPHL
jgi:type II secretory pathway component PulF